MMKSRIQKSTVECIYRQEWSERETCDCCESILIITDEGFMACKNPSVVVLYIKIC